MATKESHSFFIFEQHTVELFTRSGIAVLNQFSPTTSKKLAAARLKLTFGGAQSVTIT